VHNGLVKAVVVSSVFALSGCCGSASYRAHGSYQAGTQRPAEPPPASQPPVVEQPTQQPTEPSQHGGRGRPVQQAEPGRHGGRGVPVVNTNPRPEPPEDLPPFGTTEPIDNALTGNPTSSPRPRSGSPTSPG
jgi:hypothetical protein